jgi:hypothetical protein
MQYVVVLPVVMLALLLPSRQDPAVGGEALSRAVEEVERLDALRSGLAGSFGATGLQATGETFRQVCAPVGARAREVAAQNGWTVQQLALKNRNPANALDEDARRVYELMERNPGIDGLWEHTTFAGTPGLRYFRRITVERACLACHGPRDERPAFVRDGYPQDRAFDFAVGDLRGLYAVFIPDSGR